MAMKAAGEDFVLATLSIPWPVTSKSIPALSKESSRVFGHQAATPCFIYLVALILMTMAMKCP